MYFNTLNKTNLEKQNGLMSFKEQTKKTLIIGGVVSRNTNLMVGHLQVVLVGEVVLIL